VAAIAKIGDHYAASKEPDEALFGKQVQLSGLVSKLRSGEGDAEKLSEEVLAAAKDIVETTKALPGAMTVFNQHAQALQGDFPKLSAGLYDLIEEQYGENSDEKVAAKAKELVTSGRKRLGLVGKPLEVTGVLVGGDPFDWSEYQGKVVLVHFWALLNQANLQDISDKDRIHRKYTRRGLKMVGVNLDLDSSKVKEMFDVQPLSWPTVTGANLSQRGFKHPTAQACGIIAEALPFTVLIGKDGKIAGAGLQGPALDEAIVKLLAAKEGDQPDENAADKPTDDKPAEDKPTDDKPEPDSEKKPDEESK
jgi:hypothetical protein